MIPTQVLNYIKKLSVGNHVVLFYESLEMKRQVLFTLLKEGLEREEAAVYVAAEETPEEIWTSIKNFGVDVEKYELEDSLEVASYDPLYMRSKVINPIPKTLEYWNEIIQFYQERGKKGIRAVSEVSFQFIKHGKTAELLEYEASLGRTLKIPILGVCAYNTKHIVPANGEFFTAILEAHGHAIFPSVAFKLGKIHNKSTRWLNRLSRESASMASGERRGEPRSF